MLYAIMAEDVPDSLRQRQATRPAHLARLHTLQQEGRLVIAGPHPSIDSVDPGASGYSGSLIIAEFPSLAEAKTWANADPYMVSGVYVSVTVKPFRKVLPA